MIKFEYIDVTFRLMGLFNDDDDDVAMSYIKVRD